MTENPKVQERASTAGQVRRAHAGNVAAIEALARRATRLSLRTAAVILQSREEAGDIAQDVAVDVLRSLPKLRDPDAFDGWVHKITVRHALRALRRRQRVRSAETPLALMSEADEPSATEGYDAASLLSARAALAEALARLPAKQRLALALRYVHDLPDKEIAEALGCRVGTAHALLSRGRSALRRNPSLAALDPTTAGAAR